MRRSMSLLLAALLCAAISGSAEAARFDCGQPKSTGLDPTAGDALVILRSSVGLDSDCDEMPCVCDVDGSGFLTSADALRTLRAAIDLPVSLSCECPTSTTSTSSTSLFASCPFNGPIVDLREDCSDYLYVYGNSVEGAGLTTDGNDVTVVFVAFDDPGNAVGLAGPVTGARTFDVDVACNETSCVPVNASGSLNSSGTVLTVNFGGDRFFYDYVDTVMLSTAGVSVSSMAESARSLASPSKSARAAGPQKSFLAAWKEAGKGAGQ